MDWFKSRNTVPPSWDFRPRHQKFGFGKGHFRRQFLRVERYWPWFGDFRVQFLRWESLRWYCWWGRGGTIFFRVRDIWLRRTNCRRRWLHHHGPRSFRRQWLNYQTWRGDLFNKYINKNIITNLKPFELIMVANWFDLIKNYLILI